MTSTTPSTSRPTDEGRPIGTAVRLAVAVAVFISGLVHLQLYYDGYRDFPDANLGRSFLLNGVASVVIAAALVLRRDLVVRAAAAGLLVGTLIAFALSRTDNGIFGFTERGLEPSPQAALALVLEIVGLILLAATLIPAVGPGQSVPPMAALAAAAAIAVAGIGAAALFAREETATPAPPAATTNPATPTSAPSTETTSAEAATVPQAPASTQPGETSPTVPETTAASEATAPPTTTAGDGANVVSIEDFAFVDQTLEIAAGTTVEWTNNDSFAHSVVADDGTFESERMEPGDTFSFTFDAAGEFAYHCGIHPSMIATIVVTTP